MDEQRARLTVARALAGAFLDVTSWDRAALVEAGQDVLDGRPDWLEAMADRLAASRRPGEGAATRLVVDLERDLRAVGPLSVSVSAPPPAALHPPREPSASFARLPELAGPEELSSWLGVTDGQLRWLADTRSYERSAHDEALRHYRYGWRERAATGRRVRVIERPKAHLKAIQRHVLHGLLERIPAHPAAHGFVRGRSALTHAAQHVGRRVVIGFDLEDHFASIHGGHVRAIFRTAGYPPEVAGLLAGLTTNAIPGPAWEQVPRPARLTELAAHHRLGRLLAFPHLPQGAPSSPTLANLAAHRLDRRLTGLAARYDATYSRYADDLTFSGGERLLRDAGGFRQTVAEVVESERLRLNHAKSHLTTDAGRQVVCGIVVNLRPNVPRADYDRLKGLVHACVRDGPAKHLAPAPDPRAHLEGRVAWVAALHPERGARLRERLLAVDWTR